MSGRIPRFVMSRNRRDGYAREQADGYREPKTLAYLVDAGDGRGALEVDLHTWQSETMLQVLTPRDRRMIGELGPGEAMDLHGVTLHCVDKAAI